MLRPVHDVIDVLDDGGFRAALVVAVLLAAGVWLLARHRRPVLGYAFVAVVATLVGFRVGHRLTAALVVGLVLLALGEWFARDGRSWAIRVAVLVPGALVLGAALPDRFGFGLRMTVVVVTTVAAPLVVMTAARDPRVAAALFAIAAVGVYVCVPDTEYVMALVGGLVGAALLTADPEMAATLGVGALTGLFVWTTVVGGHGRTGSVVGGIACLGVLVFVPLAGWGRARPGGQWVLLATQIAYVAFVARVAGFRQSGWAAAALALPAALIAWVVVAIAVRRDRTRE
jgi:hypothetical protein